MGMFDHYQPVPNVPCPACQKSGPQWQGKEGPRALFVWRQGHPSPVDQLMDECNISEEDRSRVRFPRRRFEIYTDCDCPELLHAVGTTEDGVWTRTELLTPANAVAYPHESERQFKRRKKTLAERLKRLE